MSNLVVECNGLLDASRGERVVAAGVPKLSKSPYHVPFFKTLPTLTFLALKFVTVR